MSQHCTALVRLSEMLAGSYSRTPIAGLPCVMSHSKNHNAVSFRPINDGERKPFGEDTTRIRCRRRTRMGKQECHSSRFLDRRREALSQSRFRLTVVSHFGKKLLARFRYELYAFHRQMRLASANTSTAEKVWTSPRS